jgi:hypothetical protein
LDTSRVRAIAQVLDDRRLVARLAEVHGERACGCPRCTTWNTALQLRRTGRSHNEIADALGEPAEQFMNSELCRKIDECFHKQSLSLRGEPYWPFDE